jgi:chaperonin GroES
MKLRPLHDWTIIKRHEPKEISAGGIIIPEAALDIPTEGTVVAIGPGRYKKEPGKKGKFTPTTLKPGQRVYFMEYATQEVELDGTEVIFIREEDILGTFEDDKQLMVKEPHPLEAKRQQPLVPHGTAATPPLTPQSKKKVKKKPVTKKKRVKKETAIAKTRKSVTKTKAKAKKATKKKTTKSAKKVAPKKTAKKTVKKPVKKKTASGTKKKTKTAKKSVKRVALKSVKGKKATPKKKSVKVPRKKKR